MNVLILAFIDLNNMVMSNVIDVVINVVINDGDIVPCGLCTLLIALSLIKRYRKVRRFVAVPYCWLPSSLGRVEAVQICCLKSILKGKWFSRILWLKLGICKSSKLLCLLMGIYIILNNFIRPIVWLGLRMIFSPFELKIGWTFLVSTVTHLLLVGHWCFAWINIFFIFTKVGCGIGGWSGILLFGKKWTLGIILE